MTKLLTRIYRLWTISDTLSCFYYLVYTPNLQFVLVVFDNT